MNQGPINIKFPALYVTPRLITAFTRSHHLSLHSSRSIQSMSSQPIPWGPFLISSFYLCQSLPSSLFPSGFVTKPCRHLATHPTHLILFDRPNNIWQRISDHEAPHCATRSFHRHAKYVLFPIFGKHLLPLCKYCFSIFLMHNHLNKIAVPCVTSNWS
jgi:hypothetical protein